MTKSLIPWVGYVKITRHGLVTLKTRRWSWKSETVTITDLCLHTLPDYINQSAARNNLGAGNTLLFRETIATYLELRYDLVEYIWDIFNKYHVTIPSTSNMSILAIPIAEKRREKSLLPVLTMASFNSLYGMHKIFKQFHKDTVQKKKNSLVNRIKEIQNRVPKLYYGNLLGNNFVSLIPHR